MTKDVDAERTGAKKPISRVVISWYAERISDPVLRLRFLRAAATGVTAPEWLPWRRLSPLGYVLPPLLFLLPVCIFLLRNSHATVTSVAMPGPPLVIRDTRPAEVWLVEQSGGSETYSNGLRVDNRFVTRNHARAYQTFPLKGGPGLPRTRPAGIVFHTTESLQPPFEAGQNRLLKRIGESLLEYVRNKRAYHFVVDRFGRVYRVVRETDAANHAGHSVWADDRSVYLNLNESFLGVAFELATEAGATGNGMSAAQLRAARMLVEMLRSRYGIVAGNCVTHGQVSVNPSNMLVGYHVDWASSFPFESVGLKDNYAEPLAAVWSSGFAADAAFMRAAGPRLSASASAAEQTLEQMAYAAGLSPGAYRKALQKQYRERVREMRRALPQDAE
ncbi:MAG: N-acetylmuramoyl-L-alanine amidase [Acidobacteriia bacterium]|nr:N-acetylmuramoyl-L-alanine amidase [Terriglobia bacterium]